MIAQRKWNTAHCKWGFMCSGLFKHKFEGQCAARDAAQAEPHVGQRVLLVRRDLEALHETHEEHEQLLPRERLAETYALPDAERVQALEERLGYASVSVWVVNLMN